MRRPLPILVLVVACSDAPSTVGSQTGGAGRPRPLPAHGTPRKPTTRALLATSTRNVLLDPFVTADGSWGHFVGLLLPGVGTRFAVTLPSRGFVGQAPAGVSAPVATIGPVSAIDASYRGLQLIAPFPGGTTSFDAEVWVSPGDAMLQPVDDAAVAATAFTVALLPNDEPAHAFRLARSGTPIALGGRQWVRFALPTPAPMPQGGWFSIALERGDVSLQVQAPQVTPAAAPAAAGPPPMAPRTEEDHAALRAYVEATRRVP
jgi:hypothetical protein